MGSMNHYLRKDGRLIAIGSHMTANWHWRLNSRGAIHSPDRQNSPKRDIAMSKMPTYTDAAASHIPGVTLGVKTKGPWGVSMDNSRGKSSAINSV